MTRGAFVALAIATVLACGKTAKTTNGAAFTLVEDGGPFGPAVLQAQTCRENPRLPPSTHIKGCESCPEGEHCLESHGRTQGFGTCMKNACLKDADCKQGQLCFCGPPNQCVSSNCRTAADCGGRECAPNHASGSWGSFCQTGADRCRKNQDCAAGDVCAFLGTHWGCQKAPPPQPPG